MLKILLTEYNSNSQESNHSMTFCFHFKEMKIKTSCKMQNTRTVPSDQAMLGKKQRRFIFKTERTEQLWNIQNNSQVFTSCKVNFASFYKFLKGRFKITAKFHHMQRILNESYHIMNTVLFWTGLTIKQMQLNKLLFAMKSN